MDDCSEIMTLGLENMSYTSIFNDFDETVTYDKDMFHGGIIDEFTIITVDSTTADNHESTLGTGTNDLETYAGAHTNQYSGQVEGAFGLFGNSTNTGNITVNIKSSSCEHKSCVEDEFLSNCDHKSCVDDELLSNCDAQESVGDETNSDCDTKEKADDDTNSNCDTCLFEDESVRLSGKDTKSFDVASQDHIC